MLHTPEHPHRQSLRLKGYDYALAGAYFITIVAQNRACLFGTIEQDTMIPSLAGEMLLSIWHALPMRFETVRLDAAMVMPNHFHGVIVFPAPLRDLGRMDAGAEGVPTRGTGTERVPTRGTPTLGDVVGAWKSLTTGAYIAGVKVEGWKPFAGRLWQRNYYEHIVRDDDDLVRIRHYILTNPQQWRQDAENIQQVAP